jgi:4-diphosphocytidyl-2-C-methyl-D-erythritol kinase
MTGTGSCVFAAFATESEATRALAGLPGRWQGFVTRGLAVSPLVHRLEAEQAARRADLG